MLECWNAFSLLLKLLRTYFSFYSQLSGSLFNHRSQQTFVLMKTSWRRLEDDFRLRFQKTSSRRLQEVLIKTNIFVLVIHLQDVFKTSCQDVFKTSSRYLQDVFKTFSRHLQDVLQRCLQDAFKTYHQVILFLLTSFQDAFKTYSQRFWGVLQR